MRKGIQKSMGAGVLTVLAVLSAGRVMTAQEAAPDVRLLVMISVDQLRGDMVEHYAPAFTGGFKRLADQGYRFTGASHAHAITHTAAGHATLSTGVFPSRSGIVGNNWQHRTEGVWLPMYAVEDPDSPILGAEGMEGRSPRNLIRGGLADWMLAADSDARIVSLSGKDRAAIPMAGKTKSHVYWLAPETGGFVTSEYYRNRYPGWIEDFNEDVMPGLLADSVWEQTAPEQFKSLARADSADYELNPVSSMFPHVSSPADTFAHRVWAIESPIADRAVTLLAQEAIDELDLGGRDAVDFLALSYSATDHVGHDYGPFSQEQLDNLIHLDAELHTLFTYLDEHVGEGLWVAAFSADHGIMTMPEYLAEQGLDGVRSNIRDKQVAMGQAVQEAFRSQGTPDQMARRMVEAVQDSGLVAKAYSHFDLAYGQAADSFAVLYRNSYYPGRGPGWLSRFGVEVRFHENELVHTTRGTTHGSPYWYDRYVPLILLGGGVVKGSSDARVYTVDLAPTLASFARIPVPDDLDGRVIYP